VACAALGFGLDGVADGLLVALIVAAGLESIVGYCVGCRAFGLLMRTGIVPEDVCAECADILARPEVTKPAWYLPEPATRR
jgi:hypothetical protein